MVVIVMGVAGSGKTTVGQALAKRLGWEFVDADDFHPPSNVEKMQNGVPLTDSDRRPWLISLRKLIEHRLKESRATVLACSALKSHYRKLLASEHEECRFVFLKGDYQLFKERLQEREGHFMKAHLLTSQFAALEEPSHAIIVDADQPPSAIVEEVRWRLKGS